MKRLAVLLIPFFLLSFFLYSLLPVRAKEKTVEIAYGTPTPEIALHLYREGLLRNPLTFLLIHALRKSKLEAGEYEFDGFVFPWDTYHKISKGLKKVYKVTIPEGSDLFDIAVLLEEKRICSKEDFLKYALSDEIAKRYRLKTATMEGFLFPDTYYFSKNTHPLRVIDTMHQNFLKKTAELRKRLEEKGMSIEEWVIVASMVEKETAREDERPLVSAVIYNRMRKNMKLQIDPTVIYALKRSGLWDGHLSLKDLSFDDPYNTYVYAGLPPSPICNPGLDSLKASIEPSPVDYLYFVADGNGGHHFSKTYAEHSKRVLEYRNARK
ncbi:MAG: endolytic transglycosylase MltG [Acidobacteria bacterium]|jgi:UPF0755 protein|nr:MAG: endolytic transglycosylase MltG [Acidobacteriota bacterium]